MRAVMEELRYDADKHQYFRGETPLVSVTGLIRSVWPRTDNAPENAIEKARLRGVWVDSKFEEYLTTGGVAVEADTLQEYDDCLGQAIDWWKAERGGAKVDCQVKLFGEREAGTADYVVEGHSIIDLKSTWEIARTHPAQLGGYSTLREEMGHGLTDHLGVLHVHRRFKKAQFKEFDWSESCRQWRVLRDCWRLINTKG